MHAWRLARAHRSACGGHHTRSLGRCAPVPASLHASQKSQQLIHRSASSYACKDPAAAQAVWYGLAGLPPIDPAPAVKWGMDDGEACEQLTAGQQAGTTITLLLPLPRHAACMHAAAPALAPGSGRRRCDARMKPGTSTLQCTPRKSQPSMAGLNSSSL